MSATLKRIGLVVVWAATLILVAQWGNSQTPRQPSQNPALRTLPGAPFNPPIMISGNDVGFSLQEVNANGAVGTWMVKVDGQWTPVRSAPTAQRLVK